MAEEGTSAENDEAGRPLAGERLAVARRDQDISLRDIAKELHLDESKVQALEQNQFDSLGAPVFARGHLRKYAEIVGLDADEISADYDQLNLSPDEPLIVGKPGEVSRELDLTRYIVPTVVALFVLLAIVFWVRSGSPLPSFDTADDPSNARIELERPVEPAPEELPAAAVDDQPETPPVVPPIPEATVTESEPEPEQPASPVVDEPAPAVSLPSGPQVSLELAFSGNCWTEVTDADGQRLYFDLGSEGRNVVVSGTAPLRVLFGSYANVSVAVNGSDYPIPASAVRGETARFTINAP